MEIEKIKYIVNEEKERKLVQKNKKGGLRRQKEIKKDRKKEIKKDRNT